MNAQRMEAQLLLHEGLKLEPYQDTLGFWTIGVGYNLSARGTWFLEKTLGRPFPTALSDVRITREEALRVLRADIKRVELAVRTYLPEYDRLDEVRQRVAIDLAFNLAMKALGFKKAIAALKRQDWSGVARELYNSRWAKQVGDGEGGRLDRADRLVQMVLTGKDYTA